MLRSMKPSMLDNMKRIVEGEGNRLGKASQVDR